MAIVSFVPFYIPSIPTGVAGAPSYNTSQFEINSATDDTAFLFTAPRTGNIDKVAFRTAAVTTGCTLDVRLETISSGSGDHSGSLFGTNTNGSSVVADTDDNVWKEVTLTSSASVTVGNHLALVLDVSSGTPLGLQIACLQDVNVEFPDCVENDGTPVAVSYMPVMAIHYNGIGWVSCEGTLPISAINTYTFNNTSTPDIRGNRISFDVDVQVSGFWCWFDADGNVDVKIYDSDGVTVIAQQNIPATYVRSGATAAVYQMYFDSVVTLSAGVEYFLVLEPSSATNASLFSYTIPSTDYLDASMGGANCAMATAKTPTGVGSWTITTTEQCTMGVMVTGVDLASGGSEHSFASMA